MSDSLVVLCGGENSRLQPLSTTLYKPFLPIHRLTMAARHITRARLCGIRQVVLVIDEEDGLIKQYVDEAQGSGIEVRLVVVAGSTATKILSVGGGAEPLLVCLGDTFARVDLASLGSCPMREGVDSAIVLSRYRLPFGRVGCDGPLATSFEEKPDVGHLVNTGYMALGSEALRLLRDTGDLARTLHALAQRRALAVAEIVPSMVVIDSMSDLAVAHSLFDERGVGDYA